MTIPIDLEPLRAVPGTLPDDAARSVDGVPIPTGRRLPMPGVSQEAFWASSGHLSEPWPTVEALVTAFPSTGLWPMLIGWQSREEHYPWGRDMTRWAHDPTPPTRDGIDILRERWLREIEAIRAYLDPSDPDGLESRKFDALGTWSGPIAPERPGTAAEVSPLGGDNWHGGSHLVLVPCARPADALLVLSPQSFNSRPDAADTVAVLRCWEERYGALPVTFGGDALEIALRRPPRTREEVKRAAVELFAFCTDFFMAHDDFEEHFTALEHGRLWSFWWD